MGLFSRKRDSKAPAAPLSDPSSIPETPGPAVPGGPAPDLRFKEHIPDLEPAEARSSPVPASSLPPSVAASPTAITPEPTEPAAKPLEEQRFVEHVTEGTTASEMPVPEPTGSPPPGESPLVTSSGDVVEPPPQHPAIAGAGAGLGAPIEPERAASPAAPISPPRTASPPPVIPAPVAMPAPQRAASPPPVQLPKRDEEERIVRPGDPVTPPADREGVQLADPKPILRNASVRSRRSQRGANASNGDGHARSLSRGRAASIRTANTAGSTFAAGAVTTTPYVDPDVEDAAAERRALASQSLKKKDESKIAKAESKHNRKLSKVIKNEAVAESKAMDVVLKELADIQRLQKSAIRDEGVAHAAHTKALAAEHKAELAFLAARRAHETALADSRAAHESLEASRAHAREMTELLREKAEEAEALRLTKGADDRERAVRVRELGGGGGGLGRLFGR